MYISLKWKAVVFLSMVLTTITVTWTWQLINKQLEAFHVDLVKTNKNHNELLNELIFDSFISLSQFSQLISSKPAIANSLNHSNKDVLKESLQKNWVSYNVNLGLDYLAIFNSNLEIIAKKNIQNLENDALFLFHITQILEKNKNILGPQYFIYCHSSCLLVALEPFINEEGERGTVALAQNMSEIVRAFYQFSKSNIGILISISDMKQELINERYIKGLGLYFWAVSDFDKIFPVLKSYTSQGKIRDNTEFELFSDKKGRHQYLIKQLNIPTYSQLGNSAYFISVDEKTSESNLVKANINRSILTGIIGLIVSELIMLVLIHNAMNRLANISHALHLLPEQDFSKAIKLVNSQPTIFKDELNILENSIIFVSLQLKKLHEEVKVKNDFLENQIKVLTRSRSFLTRLFDNSQIFIITQAFNFTILSTNKRFDEIYSDRPRKFSHLLLNDEELLKFKEQINAIKRQEIEVFQQEGVLYTKEGKTLNITWTHTLVEDEQGNEIFLSIGMDQTRQKNAEKDLRWMANHDSLTSVGNRRYFNSAFREILESHSHGALVFIDVNKFKQINDIYGHNAGDMVLIDISNQLRKMIRETDIISRYAGDEFTVLLPNITIKSLPILLENLCQSLCQTIQLGNNRVVQYSVSIGAALFPEHGNDLQTIVINADMAMYHAKKKGDGNWHIFDANDEMVVQMKNDHFLLLQLKNAIKSESFSLVYQPILDIKGEKISHYEALIRMTDDQGEPVSPGLFIPLAERSGEIRNIDEWVLQKVVKTIKDHLNENQSIVVAVNISAPTLQSHDFPKMVIDQIEHYQIEPDQLIIELTETSYIENFQQVLKNLQEVTNVGVRVALDDFGVGFSSFTYLKMLPLSFVKLDGSYIKHLPKNPDDQIFVRSLSAMITAFGMETIAEFVENQETLQMIEALGVTHGQGYYIGKPEPYS